MAETVTQLQMRKKVYQHRLFHVQTMPDALLHASKSPSHTLE